MGIERQQGSGKQQDFLDDALKVSFRHDDPGKDATGAGTIGETQPHTAWTHCLEAGGLLRIAPKGLTRMKDKIRAIIRRNRGVSGASMIEETIAFTTGWVTYYRHAQAQTVLRGIDSRIRRKLGCVRLKHCKRAMTIATFLKGNGVPEWQAWILVLSGKGRWRLACSPQTAHDMPNVWLVKVGLRSLATHHDPLNHTGNRQDTAYGRPVV